MLLPDLLFKPPYSKFILIEDTIEVRSTDFLTSIINHRVKHFKHVHYFVFEGRLGQKVRPDVKVHDFCSDIKGWLKKDGKNRLDEVISELSRVSVVIIDSLVHVINEYGFHQTYKWINELIQNKGIEIQIIAVLHRDILEERNVVRYLEHLSTFVISLEPKFLRGNNFRVLYKYKKSSGKVIKSLEEFWIDRDGVKTKPIDKIDVKRLMEGSIGEEVIPDQLTTFKISLEEHERKEKDKLVLPFHPTYNPQKEEGGVQIVYHLDENDDWDEEDPDDDLDI
ncbi:elongator complex protein 5 [Onthophagus taurus]|uniref:elongator complex protein 5 n=1 Tax=Onthophagus taurus TaxID=166361 RepID=UPI000C20E164|nr:elongator complex protein 5 [Onthophagus taurus]